MTKLTTIAIDEEVQKAIDAFRKGKYTYNEVLRRHFLQDITEVYLEFKTIDNDLPDLHTAVFQLGENTDSLYFWDGKELEPITIVETNALVKQPKPNMTITREDAGHIIYALTNLPGPMKKIRERLMEFVKELPLEQTK